MVIFTVKTAKKYIRNVILVQIMVIFMVYCVKKASVMIVLVIKELKITVIIHNLFVEFVPNGKVRHVSN